MFLYNQICETLFSVHVGWGEQFRRDTCKVVDEINLDRLIFQKAYMKILMNSYMAACRTKSQKTKMVCVRVDWEEFKFVFDRELLLTTCGYGNDMMDQNPCHQLIS